MIKKRPTILGIVNITEDSFSDGGRYLSPDRAIKHARRLVKEGADVIDLGPASSHPDSAPVDAAEEIRRIEPVIDELSRDGIEISVDTFQSETQAYCLRRGVGYINDIQGFGDESVYAAIAEASSKLIIMHSIQRVGRATRVQTESHAVMDAIDRFFGERLGALEAAGISRNRVILDPGMGFFLGSNPEPSIAVLSNIDRLRARFGLPVLVSVSRKSFLGALTGRDTSERSAATIGAEIFAASRGVDYIRTHDVGALADAITVIDRLSSCDASESA